MDFIGMWTASGGGGRTIPAYCTARQPGTLEQILLVWRSICQHKNQLEERNTVLGEYVGQYNDADIQTLITSYMNIIEAISIAISEPRLNLQRGRWNYEQVTQYYQWRDPQLFVE